MIDRDLAELYGVETKRLKEAVRRNRERFPADFMFEMNKDEFEQRRNELIFKYLKELFNPRTEPMRKIGFKRKAVTCTLSEIGSAIHGHSGHGEPQRTQRGNLYQTQNYPDSTPVSSGQAEYRPTEY